jgi:alpha-D-ribose 1-methylphosphonate 5-triphosphate synthase subunit PhnH
VPVGGAAARDAIAEEESKQESMSMMDKAVAYLKSATDRKTAYDSVMKHYGAQLTDNQKEALKKFVR